jgi:hypothetical protein
MNHPLLHQVEKFFADLLPVQKETEHFRSYRTNPLWVGLIIREENYKYGVVYRNSKSLVDKYRHHVITKRAAEDAFPHLDKVVELREVLKQGDLDDSYYNYFKLYKEWKEVSVSKTYDSISIHTIEQGWWVNRRTGKLFFATRKFKILTITGDVIRHFSYGRGNRPRTVRVLSPGQIWKVIRGYQTFHAFASHGVKVDLEAFSRLLATYYGPMAVQHLEEAMREHKPNHHSSTILQFPYPRKAYLASTQPNELLSASVGRQVPGRLYSILKVYGEETIMRIYEKLRVDQLTRFYQVIYAMSAPGSGSGLPEHYQGYNAYYNAEMILQEVYKHILKLSGTEFITVRGAALGALPVEVEVSSVIADYIRDVCAKRKVNLNIGYRRMHELHKDWARARNIKTAIGRTKLRPSKVYKDVLQENNIMIPEFIDTNLRLTQEGETMKHCVASYHPHIQSGRSGIYSILYKVTGYRYTLELQFSNRQLRIAQLRGFANSNAPVELMSSIQLQIDEKNVQLSTKAGSDFVDSDNLYTLDEAYAPEEVF